ncbi:MAG: hypothetical protein ACO1NX_00585, partial [Chitinophagaceae bacterium]
AAELAGEMPAPGKKDGTKMLVLKNIFSDYDKDVAPWRLMPCSIQMEYGTTAPQNLLFSFYATPEQPPEAAAA